MAILLALLLLAAPGLRPRGGLLERALIMIKRRDCLGAALLGPWAVGPLWAAPDRTGGDPQGSMQWPSLHEQYLDKAPVRFTDAVLVRTPAFADDALNVPLQIDARATLDSIISDDPHPITHNGCSS